MRLIETQRKKTIKKKQTNINKNTINCLLRYLQINKLNRNYIVVLFLLLNTD